MEAPLVIERRLAAQDWLTFTDTAVGNVFDHAAVANAVGNYPSSAKDAQVVAELFALLLISGSGYRRHLSADYRKHCDAAWSDNDD